MLVKFIYLFTIAIIAVQGNIPSYRIETDVAEFARLYKEYMERSPYPTIRGQYEASCGIMNECCPEKREHFFDIMHLHKLESTCIGDRTTSTFKSFSSTCRGFIEKLDGIKKSQSLVKLLDVHRKIPNNDEKIRSWRVQMSKVCLTDELEAFYCEPENTKIFQTCQKKVLRMVARESGDKGYNAYVHEFKSRYHSYIEHLIKAFPDLSSE